jgi:predicted DCC family thiol-disulfide oxidoreductase YuxK
MTVDDSRNAGEGEGPIVLFDGVCVLCCGGVRFLLAHDARGRMRFAAMQSPEGQALLRRHHLPLTEFRTFAVLDGGRVLVRSDAALRLADELAAPLRWLRFLRVVPRILRDAIYDLVARSRYRIFGRREQCFLPAPTERARFL